MCLTLQNWADIARIIQAVIVLLAFSVAIWQIKEARKLRKLKMIRELISEIGDEEIRKIRGWVIHDMPQLNEKNPLNGLSLKQIDDTLKLAVAYDRVCFMILESGYDIFKEFHNDDVFLIWDKLEMLIKYSRDDRETKRPKYCISFKKYMEKKYIKSKQ